MTIRLIVVTLALLVLEGCTGPSMAPNKPARTQANKTLAAQPGVVLDIQAVSIEGNARSAQVIGGAVGGAIGNEVADDSHGAVRTVATAAGAAAGAVIGDQASKTILSTQGEELIIQLDAGRVISVIQAPGTDKLSIGQTVWVVEGAGSTRVLPRT